MKTILAFLLLATSDGASSTGITTVIASFSDEVSCISTMFQMRNKMERTKFTCNPIYSNAELKNAKANEIKINDVILNLENKYEQITEIKRTHDGDVNYIYLNKNKYLQDAPLKVIR